MMTESEPIPVNCPICNNQIGEEIERGIVLIHAGGGIWRELRGYCAQCGKSFYWSSNDCPMEQVIKVLNPKGKTDGK